MRSYADDVQCYFSFDRDSSVDMIRAHKCACMAMFVHI